MGVKISIKSSQPPVGGGGVSFKKKGRLVLNDKSKNLKRTKTPSQKEKHLSLLSQHIDSLKEETHQLNFIISEIKNVVSVQQQKREF